jgi:hypothetical protein
MQETSFRRYFECEQREKNRVEIGAIFMEIFKKYSFGVCKLGRSLSILVRIRHGRPHSVGILDTNSSSYYASKSKQYSWRYGINTLSPRLPARSGSDALQKVAFSEREV